LGRQAQPILKRGKLPNEQASPTFSPDARYDRNLAEAVSGGRADGSVLTRSIIGRVEQLAIMQQNALMRFVVQLKRVCVKANWQTHHDMLTELEKASE
jgi:hypothetical protein